MLWFGCITPILTSTFTLPSSVSIFSPLMRTPVVEFTTWPKSKTTSSQDTELITSTRTLLSSKVTLWDCRRTWIFGEGGWEQCSTHYSYIKVRYNSLLPLLLSFFFFFHWRWDDDHSFIPWLRHGKRPLLMEVKVLMFIVATTPHL